MSEALLVHNIGQLVTVRGPSGPRRGAAMRDLGIIQNGAVLIEGGRIVAVGPAQQIEKLIPGRATELKFLNAGGAVVLPGFVDSHTHLVWTRPRLVDYEMRIAGATYAAIANAGGGILSTVAAVRDAPPKQLLDQARRALMTFLSTGTTTIEAKSGYGLNDDTELKILDVAAALREEGFDIVSTYLGAHVVPPDRSADDYIEWMVFNTIPQIARENRATFADAFCEEGAFTLEQTRTYLDAARRAGLGLKLHAEQFSHSGAARMGVEMSAASIDHLESATFDDATALARSQTIATLLPGAVFHLGLNKYAPARMLIDQGAAVALATDYNPGTSPTSSMPMILSLACTQMRVTPAEAIVAATINGAHALRIAYRTGSIEEGKDGNLAIFNADDYREIPYRFGVNLVSATVYRGMVVPKGEQLGQTAH